ncbi:hypothetical protein trd_A0218 (plasmid) [Thermomicrobium roseum DSM 5159]|uniref:Uncharacterized protein n=1 Tax=Thermomicrobium roseum (strain ATCC 27502 / DSM 5159 / P-2) TaxID=309801 RepID=B9L354_THERP|nr:hypothetical protein trd_A0218 [Thermomicrobium roseum DSM 5159]
MSACAGGCPADEPTLLLEEAGAAPGWLGQRSGVTATMLPLKFLASFADHL